MPLPPFSCPVFLHRLPRTAHRQGIGRNRLGEHGARGRVSSVADFKRRYERRIAPDEGPRADGGPVLFEAIVIAGDCARADVGCRANARIAQVRQVAGLSPRAQFGLLQLDEVADVRALAHAVVHP